MNSLQQADKALSNNDIQKVAYYLDQHLKKAPDDVRIWFRLADIQEQLGQRQASGYAYRRCLELMPNAAQLYCHIGNWLLNSDEQACAAAFSLAYDIDPNHLLTILKEGKELGQKAGKGALLMCDFLRKLHQTTTSESQKISDAMWVRYEALRQVLNDADCNTNNQPLKPELFLINDVRQQAYYSLNEFDWSKDLINSADDIQRELRTFLASKSNTHMRPYLDKGSVSAGDLVSLAGSYNWSAIDLYKDGQANEEIHKQFPLTINALSKAPSYGLDKIPFEAFFSVLKAGQVIAPHYGQSNHSLTVHLPIDTPSGAYLEVNEKRRYWAEEELIIFDDNFIHSANNESDEQRVILLFSIWHPDLNLQDRHAVQKAFKQRGLWLDQRYQCVINALPTST